MRQASVLVLAVLYIAAVVQAGEPGKWADGDIMNGDWVPSRSTHYGWVNGGACGQGTAPNCWTGRMDAGCDKVPEGLKTPMGGLYAAPQGDYYAQQPNGNYVSCGECFQIRCDDPNCIKDNIITVFISDACPCLGNEKWCCNVASDCKEMSTYPSLEGPPHCPQIGGPWNKSRSIHLDLSNYAFALLERGDRTISVNQGFLNTYIRRVSCPVYNNSIWMSFAAAAPVMSSSCVLGGGGTIRAPCFYFLLFGIMGAGGPGGVARVQFLGRYSYNNTVHDGPLEMEVVDRPDQDPQGRYGAWSVPNNYALALPFRLRFWSRTGEMAESIDMTPDMFNKLEAGGYVDTKAQFGWAPPPTLPPPPTPGPVHSTGSIGPTGPKPNCWAKAIDQGTNENWLAFQISAGSHSIASASVVGNGQTIKLTGPNNWGPNAPTVYTGSTNNAFAVPYVLRVVDSAGAVNELQVDQLGQYTATYTC